MMKKLIYKYEDGWGRAVFQEVGKESDTDMKYADISLQYMETGFADLCTTTPFGEPDDSVDFDYEIVQDDEVKFLKESAPYRNDYAMLGRYKSDCDYFLGYGNRSINQLYFDSIEKQIEEMLKLWDKFPSHLKPEWLSREQILSYKENMEKEG
jgi:hypothetical protein